ncbi:MAG: hypothetical protein NTV93_11165 [Verrucomicrobia bacterium]|nr:hypothetical protein [Verrucomicrobiota bacterium]
MKVQTLVSTQDFAGKIFLGSILLEKNRWPDTPSTKFSLGTKLSLCRACPPTVKMSQWSARARADGFDGVELWENHALLADDEEFDLLCRMATPTAVYSSYFGLDDQDAVWREVAAGAVKRLGARAVKYNFGSDPMRRDVCLRNLRDWVALLDADVRILCECHKGNIGGDLPEMAAELLAELGDDRYQATIHLDSELPELELWFKHLGSRIRHVHAGRHTEKGRAFLADRIRLLRSFGFAGSFSVEFTKGIEWGKASPDVDLLYQHALDDMTMLREELAK